MTLCKGREKESQYIRKPTAYTAFRMPFEKLDVVVVVIRFQFGLSCKPHIINVMDLFVQAIAHDECVCQCQSLWLHRMSFLSNIGGKSPCLLSYTPGTYSKVMRADAFGSIIRYNGSRVGLMQRLGVSFLWKCVAYIDTLGDWFCSAYCPSIEEVRR